MSIILVNFVILVLLVASIELLSLSFAEFNRDQLRRRCVITIYIDCAIILICVATAIWAGLSGKCSALICLLIQAVFTSISLGFVMSTYRHINKINKGTRCHYDATCK